ncbi:MAG: hypothetical protein HZY76_01200 [Anaerolineae bacterium]|nr:MAG: hypothetical protein HZY76_01200 [Anaerolineae bacterium]
MVAPLLLFPNPITPWAALLLLMLWPLRWQRRGQLSRRTPLDWAVALLLVMLLVGYAQAIDRSLAEPRFWSMLLSLAAFYAVVNTATATRQVWLWAMALVLLGAGIALLGLVGTNWFTDKIVDLGALYGQLPRLLDGTLGPWRRAFTPMKWGHAGHVPPTNPGPVVGRLAPGRRPGVAPRPHRPARRVDAGAAGTGRRATADPVTRRCSAWYWPWSCWRWFGSGAWRWLYR